MDDDIKRLPQETCLALIPQFYDGVLEATRVQQVHDAIIEPFCDAIMRIHRNAYIQTMDGDALSAMERGLGIDIYGTIEQRRQAVINAMSDPHIMNDSALLALIQSLSGGATNDFSIDAQNLILQFEKMTNTQGEHEADELKEALETAQPVIPSNLATEMAVLAENDIEATAIYGWTSILETDLGTPEFVKGITHYGYLTSTGEDVSIGEIPMGGFTGGIVAQYDADLVQTTIPMGYMQ